MKQAILLTVLLATSCTTNAVATSYAEVSQLEALAQQVDANSAEMKSLKIEVATLAIKFDAVSTAASDSTTVTLQEVERVQYSLVDSLFLYAADESLIGPVMSLGATVNGRLHALVEHQPGVYLTYQLDGYYDPVTESGAISNAAQWAYTGTDCTGDRYLYVREAQTANGEYFATAEGVISSGSLGFEFGDTFTSLPNGPENDEFTWYELYSVGGVYGEYCNEVSGGMFHRTDDPAAAVMLAVSATPDGSRTVFPLPFELRGE